MRHESAVDQMKYLGDSGPVPGCQDRCCVELPVVGSEGVLGPNIERELAVWVRVDRVAAARAYPY